MIHDYPPHDHFIRMELEKKCLIHADIYQPEHVNQESSDKYSVDKADGIQ